ncbi:MAG TPA: hypothetical protein PLG15_05065 [Candidatus Gastranaerophilaceae bacterium]|nr:hypothetical protein [Candidatus Gastranaerophilaceae bacterium]HPT41734.1 hypothetical protein [Candidatus Gastranaerophilaceae bacterium]
MHEKVEKAVNLLIAEFSKRFDDFHGIYLYGLFLDGNFHEEEDIELVAVFDSEDKAKRELIWPIVGKVETELDVFIDLNPTTMAELEKDEELYEDVVKNGLFFNPLGQSF